MLDTITKKRINDCRDILVGKLPDPKAQIEQITIALIYKFMDDMDKETIELGGKAKFFSNYTVPDPQNPEKEITVEFAKYRWDALFDPKVTAAEMLKIYSEAIENMEKNPNIPQLFRDIFSNAYLPYRDPETLKLFLKTIGEFEYTHSEDLGDAFEYLLQVMGAQGDAGQFRTPRHIIDFLVEAVNPQKTDIILDPACGTAGFLISAFKYIRRTSTPLSMTPDEQRRLIENIKGYDISPDMVRLSLVNLYLHNFSDPHIFEYDTLSSEERWDETADVILANPPFMSPKGGIRPHKRFSIQSKRSEVLFVDYIAEHLKPGGRAGVIVPEGIIFQSGKAYKELRKMLVENYLYAVVSLPAGVFNPYSGVKTSILLMDKELAKTTNEILFVKIENDGLSLGAQRTPVKGSQLEEAIEIIRAFRNRHFEQTSQAERSRSQSLAHAVAKTEIAKTGEYNLSGERYKVANILASDYELVKLGDVCDLFGGGTPSKSKEDFWNDGKIKWISAKHIDNFGNIIGCEFITEKALKNSSTKIIPPNSLIFITRVSVGKYAYTREEYAINQDLTGVIPKDNKLLSVRYLNGIASKIANFIDKQAVGIGVRGITRQQLAEIQIPLPPLSVQKEIVNEIEGYQKIIDGAKMVVENYKPKIDIDPEWDLVELNTICDVRDGTHDSPKYVQNGGIPFITQKNITKEGLSFDNVNYISEQDHKQIIKRSNVEFGDIIFSMIGANRGMSCLIDDERIFSIKNVGLIKSQNKASQKFLLFYLQSQKAQEYVTEVSNGGAQSFISLRNLRAFPVPLPPIEIQNQIVTQIEKEQALVNANKALIEIYEQKIKDRIAKVWGAPASPENEEPAENEVTLAAEPEVKYRKS